MIYVVGDVEHGGRLHSRRTPKGFPCSGRFPSRVDSDARRSPSTRGSFAVSPGEAKPEEIAVNVKQMLNGKAEDLVLLPQDVPCHSHQQPQGIYDRLCPIDRLRRRLRCDLPLLRILWKTDRFWKAPVPDPLRRKNGDSKLLARPQYVDVPYSPAIEEPGSGLLLEYLDIVRRHKGTLILVAFLGLLAALLLTLPQTPIYQAHASLEIQNLNEDFHEHAGDEPHCEWKWFIPGPI